MWPSSLQTRLIFSLILTFCFASPCCFYGLCARVTLQRSSFLLILGCFLYCSAPCALFVLCRSFLAWLSFFFWWRSLSRLCRIYLFGSSFSDSILKHGLTLCDRKFLPRLWRNFPSASTVFRRAHLYLDQKIINILWKIFRQRQSFIWFSLYRARPVVSTHSWRNSVRLLSLFRFMHLLESFVVLYANAALNSNKWGAEELGTWVPCVFGSTVAIPGY